MHEALLEEKRAQSAVEDALQQQEALEEARRLREEEEKAHAEHCRKKALIADYHAKKDAERRAREAEEKAWQEEAEAARAEQATVNMARVQYRQEEFELACPIEPKPILNPDNSLEELELKQAQARQKQYQAEEEAERREARSAPT